MDSNRVRARSSVHRECARSEQVVVCPPDGELIFTPESFFLVFDSVLIFLSFLS